MRTHSGTLAGADNFVPQLDRWHQNLSPRKSNMSRRFGLVYGASLAARPRVEARHAAETKISSPATPLGNDAHMKLRYRYKICMSAKLRLSRGWAGRWQTTKKNPNIVIYRM